jgi:hypothetical protein
LFSGFQCPYECGSFVYVALGVEPMSDEEEQDEPVSKPERREKGHWEYVHCNWYWVPEYVEDDDDGGDD